MGGCLPLIVGFHLAFGPAQEFHEVGWFLVILAFLWPDENKKQTT